MIQEFSLELKKRQIPLVRVLRCISHRFSVPNCGNWLNFWSLPTEGPWFLCYSHNFKTWFKSLNYLNYVCLLQNVLVGLVTTFYSCLVVTLYGAVLSCKRSLRILFSFFFFTLWERKPVGLALLQYSGQVENRGSYLQW